MFIYSGTEGRVGILSIVGLRVGIYCRIEGVVYIYRRGLRVG